MIQKIKRTFVKKQMRKIRKAATFMIVLVCSLVFMIAASAVSTYNVSILDEGKTILVSTRKNVPEEILAEAEIVLGENDYLDISNYFDDTDSQLTIYRACNIKVIENGKTINLVACKTVNFTLEKNLIRLGPDDIISVSLDEPVFEGMVITLERAFGITVIADGKTIDLQTTPGTVADAVDQAKVKLDKDDETIPALKTDLSSGMSISVLRIKYFERTETEIVRFEKRTKKTDTLYVGQSKVSQAGVNGEKSIVYKDRIVNGAIEETSIVSEIITKKPIDRVVLIGSKKKIHKIALKNGLSPISNLKTPASLKFDADGFPINYKKIIDGTSTAYSGGGTTATGRPAMEGYIAVNPKQIPYGTKLYVVSSDGRYVYGYCIAADTGGFARNNSCTIDIYMNSENDCIQFGRRAVRIFVLD